MSDFNDWWITEAASGKYYTDMWDSSREAWDYQQQKFIALKKERDDYRKVILEIEDSPVCNEDHVELAEKVLEKYPEDEK